MTADMTNDNDNEHDLLALIDAICKLEMEYQLGKRLNIFEAVNMTRQEIRHSRFLAFLLDPRESHGLGDQFLRSVLKACASKHPSPPLSRLDVAISRLDDAIVHCERDRFDITVELPALSVMFVIENKIGAKEGGEQLNGYREKVESKYSNYQFMGCFLTPDGYEGADNKWGQMSYTVISEELKLLHAANPSLSDDISVLLKHYIELIERKIVVPEKLIKACREIYKQHKNAIDLIWKHGSEPVLCLASQEFVEEHEDLKIIREKPNVVIFDYKAWGTLEGLPKAGIKGWNSEFPIVFVFELKNDTLSLRLEVGPFADNNKELRDTLIYHLRQRLKVKQTSNKDVYTRILTHSHKLSIDDGVAGYVKAMNDLWKNYPGNDIDSAVKNFLSKGGSD